MIITLFHDRHGFTLTRKEITEADLANTIAVSHADDKKNLGLLKLAEFGKLRSEHNSLRNDKNVLSISGVEADYDQEVMTFADAVETLEQNHLGGIVYTSPSHTEQKPRWRILCPFSRSYPPSERTKFLARLNGLLNGVIGPESFTLSQAYFYGYVGNGGERPSSHRVEIVSGEFIDLRPDLDAGGKGKTGKATDGNGETHWEPIDKEGLTNAILTGANLHIPMRSLAGSYAARGSPKQDCIDYLGLAFTAANQPRYDGRWQECLKIIDWCYAKEAEKHAPTQPQSLRRQFGTLMTQTFSPLKWVIPRYVPEGVTLLAGKPKVGKSWLALAAGLACVRGETVLGEICPRRNVLLCALEDNERRLYSRMQTLMGSDRENLENFFYELEIPRLDKGCASFLKKRIDEDEITLIIIDTLAAVASPKGKDETQNAADYRNIAELSKLAHETGVSVIIVHHLRKQGSEDKFDTISGTLGIAAAADHLAILDHEGDGLRLCTRGRDAEPEDKLVDFDSEMGEWTVTGDYEPEDKGIGKSRQLIQAALGNEASSMKPAEVAKMTGLKLSTVQQTLRRMAKNGEVKRTGYGTYHV